jgi:hypothetical protein
MYQIRHLSLPYFRFLIHQLASRYFTLPLTAYKFSISLAYASRIGHTAWVYESDYN